MLLKFLRYFVVFTVFTLSACDTLNVKYDHSVIYPGYEYHGCTLTLSGAF